MSRRIDAPDAIRRANSLRRWFAAVRVVLIVAALGVPAYAQNRESEIAKRGRLRVGTTGDYPPFTYRANARSPYVGLDVEFARRLAQALGVTVEFVPTSWPTLMKDFGADRFDIAMGGVSITADRQRAALFSIPYLQDGKTPIARCEAQTRFQRVSDIDQPTVRVIVNPGGTNERFIRANAPHAAVIVWNDNVTIFDQIVSGAADVMITDAIEARLQQRLRPQLCAIHPEAPFDVAHKAYLLVRDEGWKERVDQWLRPIVAGGELQRRLDHWLDHPWPRAAPATISLEPLRAVMAERLRLMTDVARHKWNSRAPIEDPARERQVIDGLKRAAQEFGVPNIWAEHFFRAQIEAAKIIQRACFAEWQRNGVERFSDVPDLDTNIRPRLDGLTPHLLRELAAAWPALSLPEQRERIQAAMQTKTAEPTMLEPWRAAAEPLVDGSASNTPAEELTR